MGTRSLPRSSILPILFLTVLFGVMAGPAYAQQGTRLGCDRLAQILTGKANPAENTCKVNLPRADLEVMLLGAKLPLSVNRTSWTAFTPTGASGAMVMGDLVLTHRELPQVMRGLRDAGIEITAVHSHMLGENPEVIFMHYQALGDATEMARGIHAALARASALGESPAIKVQKEPPEVAVAGTACPRIAEVLAGDRGSVSAGPGWCKVSMARPGLIVRMRGHEVPPAMGFGHWFGFVETGDGEAMTTGDFVLRQEEINPVITALLEHGINVVRLHNHMMFEEPRVQYFHFQARGEPLALARGLRAGLDALRQR
jgi:hypothetical protein